MSLLLLFQQVVSGGGGGETNGRAFWRRIIRKFLPNKLIIQPKVIPHRVGPFLVE